MGSVVIKEHTREGRLIDVVRSPAASPKISKNARRRKDCGDASDTVKLTPKAMAAAQKTSSTRKWSKIRVLDGQPSKATYGRRCCSDD